MQRRNLGNERGMAMVLSLLMLMALTMIGALFLMKTKTERQISGHTTRSTQALFNAEAGYAEALARMTNSTDSTNYIGQTQGAWNASPGWGRYLVSSSGSSSQDSGGDLTENDGLDNDGDNLVDESGERYPEITSMQSTGMDYPWVKIRYKTNSTGQVLLFGDHDSDVTTDPVVNLARGNPVLVVSSEGARGSSRRRVEVEAVKFPFVELNTAMYSETDDFKFNGTQFLISGEDHDPVTWTSIPGNSTVPAITTTGDPDEIENALAGNQINNVTGSGANPSVDPAVTDYDLQAILDQYAPAADIPVTPGTHSNVAWGGIDDYHIVHCSGSLHATGQGEGGGLLLIDGDFECTGQFTWYGIVVVMGDIRFSGGGSGKHLLGAVLVQGRVDQQVVGGNADILYSSEALARMAIFMPYVVTAWHEL